MTEQEIMQNLKDKLEKAKEKLTGELNTIRAGAASPMLLDRVFVDYYETPTPLKALANTAATDGSTLVVTPFDPSNLKAIEKGISDADLGVTATNDGKVIRIAVPKPTEEMRKKLVKEVKSFLEDGRIHLRQARQKAISGFEGLEKAGEFTEDDVKSSKKDVQKVIDAAEKEIEEMAAKKESALLSI
jgi:ribosome recycling factor